MIIFQILRFVVYIFFILLIGRLVLDWIQVFARDWRPRGPVLVVAEAVYSATDPPLRAVRNVLPNKGLLRIGQIQLDLAFMVTFLIVVILLNVLPA